MELLLSLGGGLRAAAMVRREPDAIDDILFLSRDDRLSFRSSPAEIDDVSLADRGSVASEGLWRSPNEALPLKIVELSEKRFSRLVNSGDSAL